MESNNSRHFRALAIGLSLFAFTVPFLKSIGSIMMGLVYLYGLIFIFSNKNFRDTILHHINQPLAVPIGIYVLVVLLGLSFTEHLSEGISVLKQIANLILVYLMISVIIDAGQDEVLISKNTEYLLFSFLSGILILDLIGLLTYFGFIGNARHVLPLRPLNMHHIWFGNLNAVGLYTVAALLFFSSYGRRSAVPVLLWSLAALTVISVFLSTARTAWFGIFFTTFILAYFLIRNKKVFLMMVAGIIAACVSLYLFNHIIRDRINLISSDISLFFSGVTNTSIGARFLMWKASLTLFLSHPIFGVGTGNYKTALAELVSSGMLPPFIQKFNQPHNMYLFTLATNGLIGLSALVFLFYSTLRYAGKLLHNKKFFFGFLSLAVSVHFMTAGLTESLLNIHVLICSFSLILGICTRRSCIPKN